MRFAEIRFAFASPPPPPPSASMPTALPIKFTLAFNTQSQTGYFLFRQAGVRKRGGAHVRLAASALLARHMKHQMTAIPSRTTAPAATPPVASGSSSYQALLFELSAASRSSGFCQAGSQAQEKPTGQRHRRRETVSTRKCRKYLW